MPRIIIIINKTKVECYGSVKALIEDHPELNEKKVYADLKQKEEHHSEDISIYRRKLKRKKNIDKV